MSNESKLLALCLTNDKALLISTENGINERYFEDSSFGKLFSICQWYYSSYKVLISEDALKEVLRLSTKIPQEIVSKIPALFLDLNMQDVSEPVEFLIDCVIKEYKSRQLRRLISDNIESIGVDKIGSTLPALLRGIGQINSVGNKEKREGEYLEDIDKRLEIYNNLKKEKVFGINYGFSILDEATGGHGKGELWVVLGGYKSGKTAILLNMAYNAWMSGKNVVYISAEVHKNVIERRLDGISTNMQISALKRGSLSPEDETYYKDKLASMKEEKRGKFYIVDIPGISTDEIRAKIQELKMQFPIDLVVVDYISIIQLPWKEQSNWERVGAVAWELRKIASEEEVPVLTAQQKNREGEVAHSLQVAQHLDLMLEIKVKDEAEKILSPVCTLEAKISAARDASNASFDLLADFSKMQIRDARRGPSSAPTPDLQRISDIFGDNSPV